MKIRTLRITAFAFACAITACSGDPTGTPNPPPATPAADICISGNCGRILPITEIPDAENLLEHDGRIFVSGGENVYEISIESQNFVAKPASVENCNFTGLAVTDGYLYAACGDGGLYAGTLNQSPIRVTRIHELTGMSLPNGMSDGPDGCLYIADGPASASALPTPQIVRACPDPADPTSITHDVWVNATQVTAPNGLVRMGNDFYITDIALQGLESRVVRIPFENDGSAGPTETIYSVLSVLDDLSVHGSSLLVTDYFGGSLLQIDLRGNVVQRSEAGEFLSPSSVLAVGAPLFRDGDVLLTEKGILGDTASNIGNRLTLIRRNDQPQE